MSVFLKTLRFTPQRIKSGKTTRISSCVWAGLRCTTIYGRALLSLSGIHVPNLHFEALWSLSECVWMESAETLPEPSPGRASCAFGRSLLQSSRSCWHISQGGTDLEGCRRRESWQLWDHPVHRELSALHVWALWYPSLQNAFWCPGFVLQDVEAKMR